MKLVTSKEDYEDQLENHLTQKKYQLIDYKLIKHKKNTRIKVTINKLGGVSHRDCQNVTNIIQQIFDNIFIQGEYSIEVSSPGINRELRTLRELIAFQGRNIHISYLENEKLLQFVGQLIEANPQKILLKNDLNQEIILEYDNIKKIRLYE